MSRYKVVVPAAVVKYLEKVDSTNRKRITAKILALGTEPRPAGYIKLQGKQAYRIRAGDYRIIYEVKDAQLVVIIIKAGNRKDVYG